MPELIEYDRVLTHRIAPLLLSCLVKMTKQAEQAIKDAGGCDHSVGICMCAEIAEIEQAKETIAVATGTQEHPRRQAE